MLTQSPHPNTTLTHMRHVVEVPGIKLDIAGF